MFKVSNDAQDLCSVYGRCDRRRVGPSPWWMQKTHLLLLVENRINNVVDVTNYIRLGSASRYMCLTMSGEGKKIVVRRAKQGEHFRALDGTEHELSSDMRDC